MDDDDVNTGKLIQRHLQDRERLLFTSRVLSVGEMAATLAHEINQPLGTITNVLHGLQKRLAKYAAGQPVNISDLEQGVSLAMDQAHFASRVIARIREYTASHRPRTEFLDLSKITQECVSLLDWEIQHLEVRVNTDVGPPPLEAPVMGDAVMLQQVIINLMRNALDAMRDIAPENRHLYVTLLHQPPLTRGLREEWIVRIRDSGTGLSDSAEQQLFTPFSSNKPNGMGIGLNICRSFIELHEGRLWFTRNDPEVGCTFHIALPVAKEASRYV
jgi:C4-dicarboxylate-specific signal transduction histidine kinase